MRTKLPWTLAIGCLSALGLSCFSPTYPDIIRCADVAPRCPSDRSCGTDGYCYEQVPFEFGNAYAVSRAGNHPEVLFANDSGEINIAELTTTGALDSKTTVGEVWPGGLVRARGGLNGKLALAWIGAKKPSVQDSTRRRVLFFYDPAISSQTPFEVTEAEDTTVFDVVSSSVAGAVLYSVHDASGTQIKGNIATTSFGAAQTLPAITLGAQTVLSITAEVTEDSRLLAVLIHSVDTAAGRENMTYALYSVSNGTVSMLRVPEPVTATWSPDQQPKFSNPDVIITGTSGAAGRTAFFSFSNGSDSELKAINETLPNLNSTGSLITGTTHISLSGKELTAGKVLLVGYQARDKRVVVQECSHAFSSLPNITRTCEEKSRANINGAVNRIATTDSSVGLVVALQLQHMTSGAQQLFRWLPRTADSRIDESQPLVPDSDLTSDIQLIRVDSTNVLFAAANSHGQVRIVTTTSDLAPTTDATHLF